LKRCDLKFGVQKTKARYNYNPGLIEEILNIILVQF